MDQVELAWIAPVKQSQLNTPKNKIYFWFIILGSIFIFGVTIQSYLSYLETEKIKDSLITLIGGAPTTAGIIILLFLVLFSLLFRIRSRFFKYTIFSWGVTRINSDEQGNVPWYGKLLLNYEKFLLQNIPTRFSQYVALFKNIESYKQENDLFVLKRKGLLPHFEFTLTANNNIEAITSLLNKYINPANFK